MKYINTLLLVLLCLNAAYARYEAWDIGIGYNPVAPYVPKKPTPVAVHTTTTTTTKPDGTVITTVVDKSVIKPPRSYKLGLGISTPWDNIKGPQIYEFMLSKRILDPLWLGVGVNTNKELKLMLEVEL